MPGRGRPWREGGHVDDTILGEDIKDLTITNADIADGTITEVKLDSGVTVKLNAAGGHSIQDEGTPLVQRGNLNFVGAGVVASDGIEDTTTVTIAGVADGVGYDQVDEEGTPLIKRSTLRFTGDLVTALDSESTTTIQVKPIQIQDEGVNLNALRPTIDFVGAGVVATDGPGLKTTITIPGGGAGAFDPYTTTPETYHYFYDEFYYPNLDPTVANAHWERIGSLGFQTPASIVGGVVEQSTNEIVNTVVGIRTCAGGLVDLDLVKKFKVVWAILNRDAVANSAQRIGLFAEAQSPSGTFPFSSEPTPSLWFAHDGSGNWLAETNNGVTPVSIDTGVAVDLLMHVFEISFDPAGTPTVTFKIDGVSVATSTANIPTGDVSVGAVIQTGITSIRTHRIDTALIVNDR